MDLRNSTIDGKVMEVITEEEFCNKYKMYLENPSICSMTSVEVEDGKGNFFILPIRGRSDDRPGIYTNGMVYYQRFPDDIENSEYNKKNLDIVDFSDIKNIEEFLDKNSQIREMETTVLTDIDSVFTPPLLQDDSQEMRAVKDSIISKHIDINKYAPRFGDNFLNDKRILKTNSITMNKLISICEKLDIEAELTLRNANPDVPNPMSKEVTVILTNSGGGEE